MGQYANNASNRGADVAIRLYRGGSYQDIIEAETIEFKPMLAIIESAPLSVGHVQEDVYPDRMQATVKGVKKGNAFLGEVLDQFKKSMASGKPLDKYSAAIQYRDTNTNTVRTVKIGDASLVEIDDFASGGINEKQREGFAIRGQLK